MRVKLISSEICTEHILEKKEGMVAKIDAITGSSILDGAKCLRNFILYERNHGSVDVVIAELPPLLIRDISSTIEMRDYSFEWSDFGFLCIPLVYIHKERKITPHYTTIQNFPKMLDAVAEEMKLKNQRNLYQICTAQNQTIVEKILESKDFEIMK